MHAHLLYAQELWDPQRNEKMIGTEETLRQRFERLKHPAQSSPSWKKDLKAYVN